MHRTFLAILLCLSAVTAYLQCVSAEVRTCSGTMQMRNRREVLSIKQFGGVGDGWTLNTKAFWRAIYWIQHVRKRGGTLLYIPPGVWLTGSFNLTSHMTLYLARGAVIRATQDTQNWPLIDPLPSYGRGRERPGGRHMSLIHGNGLRDVIITGENGIIDGQGDVWWNMWWRGSLKFTRPSLIELIHSRGVIISNVTLRNSPFWNIHPVYCSKVVVRHVTILAPSNSPNTDGIDPDSSSNVCIEDCHIATGDDLVAVKSGWDEYGIAYGRPSDSITILRLTGSTPYAGIAIGSEISGGIQNVYAENINLFNSGIGIHVKTNIGRGGFIKNVTVTGMYMNNVQMGIKMAGTVGEHPDNRFNPKALTVVDNITVKNLWGVRVQQPGSIQGVKNSPFTRICLSGINFGGTASSNWRSPWKCADVSGAAHQVSPWPCMELTSSRGTDFCSINR